jgi:hypothetical protein
MGAIRKHFRWYLALLSICYPTSNHIGFWIAFT